jgi:DNA polymerase III delta subunit
LRDSEAVYSFILKKEIDDRSVHPAYFFYGEEPFLAEEFVREILESLLSPEEKDYRVEKYSVEDHSWMEIMDSARTLPFFFYSWRIVWVSLPVGKGERLSSAEEKVVRAYFSSPSPQTIVVVVYPAKLKRNASIFRLFSSFPSSLVCVKELRPLKGRALFGWMEKKLSSLQKRATQDALRRIAELAGSNLAGLNNELKKISSFIGDKRIIELDDVNAVSGWIKSFDEWEILDGLEKADRGKTLMVLGHLFKEGEKPVYILGLIAKFFRDVFLAKLWLREKEKDKKAIFRELKPQIQERFGNFYTEKFRDFFALVEGLSMEDLALWLSELKDIDLKIKTTDLSAQTLLEEFLLGYTRLRRA